jgi:hypothetical protein
MARCLTSWLRGARCGWPDAVAQVDVRQIQPPFKWDRSKNLADLLMVSARQPAPMSARTPMLPFEPAWRCMRARRGWRKPSGVTWTRRLCRPFAPTWRATPFARPALPWPTRVIEQLRTVQRSPSSKLFYQSETASVVHGHVMSRSGARWTGPGRRASLLAVVSIAPPPTRARQQHDFDAGASRLTLITGSVSSFASQARVRRGRGGGGAVMACAPAAILAVAVFVRSTNTFSTLMASFALHRSPSAEVVGRRRTSAPDFIAGNAGRLGPIGHALTVDLLRAEDISR